MILAGTKVIGVLAVEVLIALRLATAYAHSRAASARGAS
jgi:hypothetical protein